LPDNFVCNTDRIFELFEQYRTCSVCGTPQQPVRGQTKQHGLVLEIFFRCDRQHSTSWTSSAEQADHTYRINTDFAASWLFCGMEGNQFENFFDLVECGRISRKQWSEIVAGTFSEISKLEEAVYFGNISTANEEVQRTGRGTIISTDCQHNRPQRYAVRFDNHARFAVQTAMDKSSAASSGNLLGQLTVTPEMLTLAKRGPTQSKDKLGSEIMSHILASALDRIDLCVSDMSGSTRESYECYVVSNSKHTHAKMGFDPWHTDKSIAKDLLAVLTHRTRRTLEEKQREGGRVQYRMTYPEFEKLDIKVSSFLKYLRSIRRDLHDTDDHFADMVRNLWTDESWLWVQERAKKKKVALSDTFEVAYKKMLSDTVDRVVDSRYRIFTSEEESFHSMGRVYWRKGVPYGIEMFSARRGLQALDWNENHFRKSKEPKTFRFRRALLDMQRLRRSTLPSATSV
jgi:hypothetical protein